MLKITTAKKDQSLYLKLEGRIEGPWVEVLRKTWTDAMGHDKGQKVILDFGGVSFADSEGRQLLLTMQKKGVVLTKLSGFMRESLGRKVTDPNESNSQDC